MKKMQSVVLLFCTLLSFSCSSKVNREGKALIRKVENIDATVMIRSVEELNNVARYDDAFLFVTLEGCQYCEQQRGNMYRYIQDNEALIYEVDVHTYLDAYHAKENSIGDYAYLYPKIDKAPSVITFSEGKSLKAHQGMLSKDYNEFVKDMSSFVQPVNVYQVNDFSLGSDGRYYHDTPESIEEAKEQDTIGFGTVALDKQIAQKGKQAIYFTWNKCGDCKNYRNEVFNDFILNDLKTRIYTYEVDGYYTLKRNSDLDLQELGLNMWSEFSKKYHLYDENFYNTDILGNKAGFVPTVVLFEDGKFKGYDVFANEGNIIFNEDNTISFSRYFHSKVKDVKSKKSIPNREQTSSDYIDAVRDIYDQALKVDIEESKKFLQENL